MRVSITRIRRKSTRTRPAPALTPNADNPPRTRSTKFNPHPTCTRTSPAGAGTRSPRGLTRPAQCSRFHPHSSMYSTWRNSGFKPLDSAMNQLIMVTHNIHQALENKQDVCMVYLDISKAFDRVWHIGLLHKLETFGEQTISAHLYFWEHHGTRIVFFNSMILCIVIWVVCDQRGEWNIFFVWAGFQVLPLQSKLNVSSRKPPS